MRNVIPLTGIAVVVIAVAGLLLRWRSARRRRRPPLPPLFYTLGTADDTSRLDWRAATNSSAVPSPIATQSSDAFHSQSGAAPERDAIRARANEHVADKGEVVDPTKPQTTARADVAATNVSSNPIIAASNSNGVVTSNGVNSINGVNANGLNLASNNGVIGAHVVNGRPIGASHVTPPPLRGSAPPPLITPMHLKVMRDEPNFADAHEPAPTETVRFRRPGDDAVQLLPGRLEVLAGDPRHQEIRFVRVPGRPAELILGREPGESAQHVALRSSTVSRQHARFAYVDGQWNVVNLSNTNPVVVNGEELSSYDAARSLDDGDRIELGEVVLRFRSH